MDPQLLARIQAMLGQQAQGGTTMPTTPFTQPPGTTLNSVGAGNPQPTPTPGQINPPQPTPSQGIQNPITGNNINMGGVGKGIGQIAGALAPKPAQMSQMQTPNLQPHQMNPQMLQMLMQQQQQGRGSPGGGGPFGDTQGYGYI
jgi:hypothetical protein